VPSRKDKTATFAVELSRTCELLYEYMQEGVKMGLDPLNDDEISEYQRRIIKIRLLFNIPIHPILKKTYDKIVS
jgi:hypothetical protein